MKIWERQVSLSSRGLGQAVVCQWHWGVFEVLSFLRNAGAELVLVTASARRRVCYLKNRFPALFSMFQSVIVADELMNGLYLKKWMSKEGCKLAKQCTKLHSNERASLAHKTPLLVSSILENRVGYDLLIDDSKETAQWFETYGLGEVLLKFPSAVSPNSNVMEWCCQAVLERLAGRKEPEFKEKPVVSEGGRFGDPFYIPLLHRRLTP